MGNCSVWVLPWGNMGGCGAEHSPIGGGLIGGASPEKFGIRAQKMCIFIKKNITFYTFKTIKYGTTCIMAQPLNTYIH